MDSFQFVLLQNYGVWTLIIGLDIILNTVSLKNWEYLYFSTFPFPFLIPSFSLCVRVPLFILTKQFVICISYHFHRYIIIIIMVIIMNIISVSPLWSPSLVSPSSLSLLPLSHHNEVITSTSLQRSIWHFYKDYIKMLR